MASVSVALPTLQNWSCHNCGGCCRQHEIEITDDERRRIEEQNWTAADGVSIPPVISTTGLLGTRHRLAHAADGACVFLTDQGLCRIHAKFGEPAKPLACRVYPYAFHPNGTGVATSLRFSCPSVVANRGESVRGQPASIGELAREASPVDAVERWNARSPQLTHRTLGTWKSIEQCLYAAEFCLKGAGSLSDRIWRTLAFADLLADMAPLIAASPRPEEAVSLMLGQIARMTPESSPAPPSRLGRLYFRLLAGQYLRKDTAASVREGWIGRMRLFTGALRLIVGRGRTPALHHDFPPAAFTAIDRPYGPISSDVDELLTRYLLVKLQGRHFHGPAFGDWPFDSGLKALLVVPAVVGWLAKWRAASQGRGARTLDDFSMALAAVDHQHGYSPTITGVASRSRIVTLAKMGDLTRLVHRELN